MMSLLTVTVQTDIPLLARLRENHIKFGVAIDEEIGKEVNHITSLHLLVNSLTYVRCQL